MIGQAIPQDNRIAQKIMEQSKQVKCCLNLPNNAQMLCFNKLTGEYNAKEILLKNFVLWEYIFKLKVHKVYLLSLFLSVQYMSYKLE